MKTVDELYDEYFLDYFADGSVKELIYLMNIILYEKYM